MSFPERKQQRLKEYDYSQNGAYFVTICTKGRLHLFGAIENNATVLNHAGKMVSRRLENISDEADVIVNRYIVMPNHIHAIILISRAQGTGTAYPQGTGRGRSLRYRNISAGLRRL